MAVAVTGNFKQSDDAFIQLHFGVVFSGTYPGAPGEPFNFLVGPFTRGNLKWSFDRVDYSNKPPLSVTIYGQAGFVYTYDPTNLTFRVWCNTAGGANAALGEHTNAAYVGGVTGDTIRGVAFLPKM